MKRNHLVVALLSVSLLVAGLACKKEGVKYFPPEQISFLGQSGGSYTISAPNVKFTIRIGVTTASTVARTIPISVSSPTGAALGTHFTLASSSIVIPANSAVGSIEVSGVFALYTAGRKDTLVFTFPASGTVKPSDFNGTYRLFVQGPCFDGDVTAASRTALLGSYTKCFDGGTPPYGPYSINVKSITTLTATTARAVLSNVWDAGFGDVNFILDWSNPSATTVTVDGPQVTPSDAANLSATYAGQRIIIRASAAGGPGRFSVCKGTFELNYQLGVFNPVTNTVVGYFPDVVTTTLAR